MGALRTSQKGGEHFCDVWME